MFWSIAWFETFETQKAAMVRKSRLDQEECWSNICLLNDLDSNVTMSFAVKNQFFRTAAVACREAEPGLVSWSVPGLGSEGSLQRRIHGMQTAPKTIQD